MKKLLSILLISSLLLSSCNKWLDVTAQTDISSDMEFETEAGFRDALIGVYLQLTHKSNYGQDKTWYFMDILCQPYKPFSASLAPNQANIQARKYEDIRVKNLIDDMWKQAYVAVANINNALDYLELRKSDLNPINYALIKGELLGLRAFIHFDLLRQFGYGNLGNDREVMEKPTIPYVIDYSKDYTDQLSYSQTINLMLNDIEESLDLLKTVDPILNIHPMSYYAEVNIDGFYNNRQKRMNYYAVQALKARVCLWEGSSQMKDMALNAAKVVIDAVPGTFSWIPSAEITVTEEDRNLTFLQEHVFHLDVQMIAGNSFANIVNSAFNSITNLYTAQTLSSYNASELFESLASDYRYTYVTRSEGNNITPIKLYQNQNTQQKKYWNIVPIIKISEMFYIAAECDPANAIEYLNTVRSQRGITDVLTPDADIYAEIQKEYRKEFIAEGQLFYYYKRLGVTKLPSPVTTPSSMNDKNYILPYPDKEILYGNRIQF
ncbi:MAG: RagB/SusD family nutrient uptake outer membrane protein [Bacteroidales bacterium]|nr:RagB/SusD family nutrient uptake outer membrane protein [Bacteroidales bacterium]